MARARRERRPRSSGRLGTLRNILRLLTPRQRLRYRLAVAGQMSTSLLDLAGVVLIGLLAVMVASMTEGVAVPQAVDAVFDRLGLDGVSLERLVVVLAVAAATCLVLKSVVYGLLMRWIAHFLARCQCEISSRMVRQTLAQSVRVTGRHSSQQLVFAIVTRAPQAVTILLSAVAIVASEATVMVVLGVALFAFDPVVTLVTVSYFAILAFVLQRYLGRAAERAVDKTVRGEVGAHETLQEALVAHRELFVLGRQGRFAREVDHFVALGADGRASDVVVQQLPKLVYESTLVVGGLALAAWQFAVNDLVTAVGVLALFLAAGFRLLPTMIRLNSQLVLLRGVDVMAQPTVELARDLDSDGRIVPRDESTRLIARATEPPSLTARGVRFTYPGGKGEAIADVDFVLPAGASLAVVGRSGSGKSTLADLILGVIEPDSGEILVGGLKPRDAIAQSPGAIAYVPQMVATFNSSVRENVLMGLTSEEVSDEEVWEALALASLEDVFRGQPSGLDTMVGERGVRLSGGQRQRLGLARGLLTRPSLLVLDEATSALDAETERDITAALSRLGGRVTTVTIAHRLSTIQFADIVAYLEDGRCLAVGSFEELRRTVRAFDQQAEILGIRST